MNKKREYSTHIKSLARRRNNRKSSGGDGLKLLNHKRCVFEMLNILLSSMCFVNVHRAQYHCTLASSSASHYHRRRRISIRWYLTNLSNRTIVASLLRFSLCACARQSVNVCECVVKLFFGIRCIKLLTKKKVKTIFHFVSCATVFRFIFSVFFLWARYNIIVHELYIA